MRAVRVQGGTRPMDGVMRKRSGFCGVRLAAGTSVTAMPLPLAFCRWRTVTSSSDVSAPRASLEKRAEDGIYRS